MNNGKVYLIGAGPGDPGLLTCRAKQLLGECDVVCYDKLVGAAILAMIPSHVQLHEVGYRGYQGTHINYGMHPDVMAFAKAGKKVARLKAGDPCIFGRMTEECRELNNHNIAYQVVPGITAALGAASYSGFPLTSAGVASSVTFVSGHKHLPAISSWGKAEQNGGTLVLYMGANKIVEHIGKLIAAGRKPQTPIMLISSATQAGHSCLSATLETLVDKLQEQQLSGPTLTIIGDVVAQSREFNWRKQLPLNGCCFVICGQYPQIELLKEKGAEVIQITELPLTSFLDNDALQFLSQQQALAFADLAAFNLWQQAMLDNGFDIRKFTMPIGSDDQSVQAALRRCMIPAQLVADNALLLTVDKAQVNSYQVGEYKSTSLPYQLPSANYLLLDNIAVARAVIARQPELLTTAGVVALNNRAGRWAEEQGCPTCAAEFINGGADGK
jgi:uroporphyrin-III C-methyltransferase